jgi:hypothetical protein
MAAAVLNSPLPKPEKEADSVAVRVRFPPWPSLIVLLTTCAPPVCVTLLAFTEILPALPPPEVSTEIFPPSAIVKIGTGANAGADTVICPAFPVLDAVLNNPLPVPEMEIDSPAVTASVPPAPSPVVLLTTCAPAVRLRLFTFSKILPAAPDPSVATEIVPPSAMVNVGVERVIWPAAPVLEAVLNSPLPKPENDADSLAVMVRFPPAPAPIVLLTT